ncbi:12450_t:CDS:2 [Funneliformis mosseae]|uniref:12450_t:CDS:1 n=1 Tax=Funneliformis mosseae TaxID=27381 RepID=A0A9N9G236_FUNMO|nr:12450_t:CDS:2 [Funneliformis mosseae]
MLHGYRKKSLSTSGALAAFSVGFGTLRNDWSVFGVVLLVFYFTGSKLTKYKAERKKQLEEEYLECGQRTASQVYSNALIGTILSVIHQYYYGDGNLSGSCLLSDQGSRFIFYMYLGIYATCNGDTWASELGILNEGWPILITTFKKVPPGTNGGISPLGLLASILGGLLIGISATISLILTNSCQGHPEIILIASVAGLIGSLIDSLLGATVQITKYNEKSHKVARHDDKDSKVVSGYDLLNNNQR